jgi:hypothetical protein
MFDNAIAAQVVNAKVGELLVAFQTLSNVSPDTLERASSELREAVGKIAEANGFEDPDILLLLIHEFAEFAVFAGSEIKADRLSGQHIVQPTGAA